MNKGAMDEKNPLLEDDSHPYWNSQPQNHIVNQEIAHPEPKAWRGSIRLLQFCMLILGLLWLGHSFPPWWTSENHSDIAIQPYASYIPYSMPLPGIQYESCGRYVKLETHLFRFNISTDHSNRWQLLDTADPETRKHLHGRIVVQPGPESQYSDIKVKAVLSSNDEADLGRLVLRDSKDALGIEYNLGETIANADLCTMVEIFVSVRPNHSQTVDLFEVRSNILDITFMPRLTWEVHNLITHTSYGDTILDAFRPSEERMTAHNVSVSSTFGLISGHFMAPKENLVLQNKDGQIGIYFWPDLYTWRALDLESISISTVSGAITMISSFNVPWPEGDYTYRLSISTDSGVIHSQAPHGSFTNYSSNSGDVSCYLRPYGTKDPNAKSEIYTTAQSGQLSVRISEAEVGDGQQNPNHNTISEHLVENGKMTLRYGYDWSGELEADITNGVLNFDGSSLDDVEKGENYVKAKRGKSGTSHINAHVGDGQLDVKLGLWS